MREYKFTLGIGFPGAEHEEIVEFDNDEFDGMAEDEIESYVEKCYRDWMFNFIDGGIERIE